MNLSDLINKINNIDFNVVIYYLTSTEIQRKLLPVQIAFFLVITLLVGLMIFTSTRSHYFQWLFIQDWAQFVTMRPFGTKKMNRQWGKTLKRLETDSESEYKLAIIEADDMLDVSLKRMGYTGQTLEERLGKLSSATIHNIQQLLETHRLRNNIVHDPDYRLTLEETKKSIDIYSQAFRDLQVLGD